MVGEIKRNVLGVLHTYVCMVIVVASFLGPAQLFVTCSTKKRREPGIYLCCSLVPKCYLTRNECYYYQVRNDIPDQK